LKRRRKDYMRAIPFRSFLRRAGAQLPGADGVPTTRIGQLEGKKRPITFSAVFFIGLVAFTMICLEGLSRYHTYYNRLEEAQVATVNYTQAAAQHAEKTVEMIDAILFGIVERMENQGTALDKMPRLSRLLESHVNRIPALQGLFVYDASGNWVVSSVGRAPLNANNAHREYFRFHQSHFDRDIHIGKPFISRSSGAWVVPMSRRLQDEAGNFTGVALATVPIQYFQDYYNSFDLGHDGAMLIAITDGTMITRRPFVATAIGTSISSGPVMTMLRELGNFGTGLRVGNLDRVERLYSYRKLDAFPLVVSAALTKEYIFASW
jgi:hypothetical protein